MRRFLLLLLLLVPPSPVPSARAAGDLDSLLGALAAPPGGKTGEVRVENRIVTRDGRRELVVRILPMGDAKLIADPGASVEVLAASGVHWPEGRRVETPPTGDDYFPGGVTLRLPFEQSGAGAIDARVEYFWCFVGWQCFLGEERIRRDLGDPTG